ncbi:MAG TPA: hypothetical protein VFO63_16785, partial [Blastocatellia bacterium]|nr:hypothetical protein [Blastocatellia bacterium]
GDLAVALFDLFHRRSGYLMATLHLGEQAAPVAGDHGLEVVDWRVHVHGPARCQSTCPKPGPGSDQGNFLI